MFTAATLREGEDPTTASHIFIFNEMILRSQDGLLYACVVSLQASLPENVQKQKNACTYVHARTFKTTRAASKIV